MTTMNPIRVSLENSGVGGGSRIGLGEEIDCYEISEAVDPFGKF
jgi:hypothetical protein